MYPWILFWTMIEISSAMFDFAITACDRYPPRDSQAGICVILEWGMPGESYTALGWIIWLSYPLFVTSRCLYLSDCVSNWAKFLAILQFITIVPSGLLVWSHFALLASGIKRWTEKKRERNL